MRRMFSLAEAAGAVNGTVINRNCTLTGTIWISGVSTDSRTVSEGELFVALKGEKFDGHDYCIKAFERGVRVFLISDEKYLPEGACGILVDDTLIAYGDLARHYRMKTGCRVVGITGSVGKTSTREMTALALSAVGKTHSTKANQNNEIGMPATILSAGEDTEYLVVEMGMRGRGEISYLTNIACPDVAVITNVGFSHIERLGSREEIRLAKMEITEGLTEGGALVVNGDDDFLRDYALSNCPMGHLVGVVSCEGDKGGFISCYSENIRDDGLTTVFDAVFRCDGTVSAVKDIRLNVSGIHNVGNALVALMCVRLLSADVEKAAAALADFGEMKGRGEVFDTGRLLVIDDAYNAAPESMEAAYARLDRIGKGRRKIAVLGGMLELGDSSPELHERIGRSCGTYSFDRILLTGDYSSDFVKGLLSSDPSASFEVYPDTEAISAVLDNVLEDGDVVLFKASNAFGFGKLADRIRGIT